MCQQSNQKLQQANPKQLVESIQFDNWSTILWSHTEKFTKFMFSDDYGGQFCFMSDDVAIV